MNIKVISIDGANHEISTTYDTTCGQLKDKINNIWRLLPSEQILRFNNVELSNPNEKLITYGIKNGSVIHLILKLSQFTVVVGSSYGKSNKILVNSKNTIKSLKEEIQKQLSIPVEEQTLMLRDEILENNKQLSEYEIDKECFISLIPRLQDSTKNKVEIQNVDLNPFQFDYMKLYSSRLFNLDRKDVYPKPAARRIFCNETSNEIQVILQTGTSRNIAVKIDVNKCISDLKSKIQQNASMKATYPALIYQGELLDNDKTIDHYGIEANSVIIVHWGINNTISRIKLLAKSLEGRVFEFYVSKNATIYDIKSKIHEKLQIHPDDQKLIYQGAILWDNRSLDEYKIGENSIIQVMPRMRF